MASVKVKEGKKHVGSSKCTARVRYLHCFVFSLIFGVMNDGILGVSSCDNGTAGWENRSGGSQNAAAPSGSTLI